MVTAQSSPPGMYQYRPLASKDSIRLLHFLPDSTPEDIRISIEHNTKCFASPSAARYVALSYCWGNPGLMNHIKLDGFPFKVTASLFEVLRQLNKDERSSNKLSYTKYWIDAICINQCDLDERSEQVHQMWRIYSTASLVIAWLGMAGAETRLAFEAVDKLVRHDKEPKKVILDAKEVHDILTLPEIYALSALLKRNYFERTWIVLEFQRAAQLEIRCGAYSSRVDNFLVLRKVVCEGLKIPPLVRARARLPDLYSTDHPKPVDLKIRELIRQYSISKCSDPRDKVFAMLGHPFLEIYRDVAELEPNYNLSAFDLGALFMQFCYRIAKHENFDWKNDPTAVVYHDIGTNVGAMLNLGCNSDVLYPIAEHRIRHGPNGSRFILLDSGDHVDCSHVWWRTPLGLPLSEFEPARIAPAFLGPTIGDFD